jgi:hypothetical protein
MSAGYVRSKKNWGAATFKVKEPFEQLSPEDQKTAIDVTVAVSLLVTRLPALSDLVLDAIIEEFSAQYNLPKNTARYALRSLGQTLFATPWTCTITKDFEDNIATRFKQESGPVGDGE